MLGAVILNNTERLLAQSPYFASRPKFTLMHAATQAGSKYNVSAPGSPCLYISKLDMFLFTGGDASTPIYRYIPENFFAGTAAVTLDTSLVVHNFVEEDSSGRVWGVVNNSSGVDGLYRRDASVATPNWTRVIAAANGSTLAIWKKTNGDIWFNDATAGNWYLLQNGTAGNSQVGAPSGLDTSMPFNAYTTESRWNRDWINGSVANSGLWTALYNPIYMIQNGSVSAESNPWASYAAIYDNSATQSLATYKCSVPYELFLASRYPNQNDPAPEEWGKVIRLSPTYSLICWKSSWGASGVAGSHPRISFALLNKSTWAIKYIGTLEVPNVVGGTGNTGQAQSYLQSARIKNGNLDLVFMGPMGVQTATTIIVGLLFVQQPLVKLDF